MKKRMNKFGALSIKFVITLIILVVSFAVILLFYYSFDWKGEIDKTACHQSVIYKATVPDLLKKKVVELPLNCKTEKICIIGSKNGNCDDDYLGEEYEPIELSSNKDEWNDEINEIFKDKIYECWWMMGQGKVQLYSSEWSTKKICTICTRIAFDKKIQDEMDKVSGLMRKVLVRDKIPNSEQTYWNFLTNSNSNKVYGSAEEDFVYTKPLAIIFAEVDASAWGNWVTRGAGTVVGAAAAGFAIGSIVPGPGHVIGAGVGGVIGLLGTGEVSKEVNGFFVGSDIASTWQIVEYDITSLKGFGCSSFEGKL